MATVRNVLETLEQLAPSRHAFGWDNVGLQVGDPNQAVTSGLVSLDRSRGAIHFASEVGAQMVVTHHPLLFEPLRRVDASTYEGSAVHHLIEHGIALASAHTNWDAAYGGINDALADRLGLMDLHAFGSGAPVSRYKLVFFCPAEDSDRVLDAVSASGAGLIGNYQRCAFTSSGRGTFVGDATTHPAVGQPGSREQVEEVRVETVVGASVRDKVVQALLACHPYEEPAYDLYPLEPVIERPMARIGHLPSGMSLTDFAAHVDRSLSTQSMAWGSADRGVYSVAICGGAADSEWRTALSCGADVLVTGEVKQHVALEASESGLCLIAAGHYATEQPGCEALCHALAHHLPDVKWTLFTPQPGMSGRPL